MGNMEFSVIAFLLGFLGIAVFGHIAHKIELINTVMENQVNYLKFEAKRGTNDRLND